MNNFELKLLFYIARKEAIENNYLQLIDDISNSVYWELNASHFAKEKFGHIYWRNP